MATVLEGVSPAGLSPPELPAWRKRPEILEKYCQPIVVECVENLQSEAPPLPLVMSDLLLIQLWRADNIKGLDPYIISADDYVSRVGVLFKRDVATRIGERVKELENILGLPLPQWLALSDEEKDKIITTLPPNVLVESWYVDGKTCWDWSKQHIRDILEQAVKEESHRKKVKRALSAMKKKLSSRKHTGG